MNGFQNILLIHDEAVGFEAALKKAIALAKRDGARLTIAETIPEPTPGPLARLSPFSSAAPRAVDDEAKGHRRRLEALLDEARRHGVEVRPALLRGEPHEAIVRTVVRQDHDLVLTAEATRTTLENLLFGKPASRVMRTCPCPVWVVKPQSDASLRRIVAAVEVGREDGQPDDLDLMVLSVAGRLARAEGAKLDIVHAWDFKGRDLETSRSELTPSMWRSLYRRNRTAHAKALRRPASRRRSRRLVPPRPGARHRLVSASA